jgi:hypothetical protein
VPLGGAGAAIYDRSYIGINKNGRMLVVLNLNGLPVRGFIVVNINELPVRLQIYYTLHTSYYTLHTHFIYTTHFILHTSHYTHTSHILHTSYLTICILHTSLRLGPFGGVGVNS